jgi:hypothetical protein
MRNDLDPESFLHLGKRPFYGCPITPALWGASLDIAERTLPAGGYKGNITIRKP